MVIMIWTSLMTQIIRSALSDPGETQHVEKGLANPDHLVMTLKMASYLTKTTHQAVSSVYLNIGC